jgi:hypothetical protein
MHSIASGKFVASSLIRQFKPRGLDFVAFFLPALEGHKFPIFLPSVSCGLTGFARETKSLRDYPSLVDEYEAAHYWMVSQAASLK